MLDLLRTHYDHSNMHIDTLAIHDTNGSGFIEQDEFEEAFDGVTSEAEMRAAFDVYDTYGNGEITIHNFGSLMENITGMTYDIPETDKISKALGHDFDVSDMSFETFSNIVNTLLKAPTIEDALAAHAHNLL